MLSSEEIAFSMQLSMKQRFLGQKQHRVKDAVRIQNSKEDYILMKYKVNKKDPYFPSPIKSLIQKLFLDKYTVFFHKENPRFSGV